MSSSSMPYESLSITFQSLLLLVVALGAILGTVIYSPVWTVRIAVTLVVVAAVLIVRLTFKPKL